MAGVKITDLDTLTSADSDDKLVIVDESVGVDGTTKVISHRALLASGAAQKANELQIGASSTNDFGHFLLFARTNGSPAVYDSVQADGALSCNPISNRIKAAGGFEGTADRALVADSANFNLSSINDIDDNFTGLVTGQVLKYDGAKWTNQNDIAGTSGAGVIAKQINTKSAGDADASFLVPLVGAVGADSVEVDNQLTYNPSSNILSTKATGADSATTATLSTSSFNLVADSATTGALYLIMREDNRLGADSAKFDLNLTYNATSETLFASNFSGDGSSVTNVDALTATSAGGVDVVEKSDDATYYMHFGNVLDAAPDDINTNTNFTFNPSDGVVTVGDVSYTATTPGDWNGTAPTTIGDAIDRRATLVKSLNGGTGA